MKINAKIFKIKLRANAPKILMIGGAIGSVAGTILACKATLKAPQIVNEFNQELDTIEKAKNLDNYTEKDEKQDTIIVYKNAIIKFTKLYGPSVLVYGLSIGSMLASHRMLSIENASLAAGLTGLTKTFNEYTKRVADRVGEEAEKEIRYNLKALEKTVSSDSSSSNKNGESNNKIESDTYKQETWSPYSRLFSAGNAFHRKDPKQSKDWLMLQEKYANEKLVSEKVVTLNDVYEMLGFDKTAEGYYVGWVYDTSKNSKTSNHIDFGIFAPTSIDFINGLESSVWLDFNVDGMLPELLKKHKVLEWEDQ